MIDWVDIVLHEVLLFSAVGLLIGGLDDFIIDIIWIARELWRRLFVFRIYTPASMDNLAPPDAPRPHCRFYRRLGRTCRNRADASRGA